jgi:hypothetical protein
MLAELRRIACSSAPRPSSQPETPRAGHARYRAGMGKGYAEGPAIEEAQANVERRKDAPARRTRKAIFGSTPRKHERHFVGWVGEVDPDELFATGKAWGISVSEIPADSH